MLAERRGDVNQELVERFPRTTVLPEVLAIPRYLQDTYWWAYIHPNAVRLFERQWLVNAILWGNFGRLRDAALDAMGTSITGASLQIACVYGDLTARLTERLDPGATLDVVDVVPEQLRNLRRKLGPRDQVSLLQRDSSALGFADATYDQTLLFFLLHEQPEAVRRKTLAEALRVTRPGGRVVIVDYHRPRRTHPLYYLFPPVLAWLEPYALDLWREDIDAWLPRDAPYTVLSREICFGGLYQQLTLVRE